MDRIRHSRGRHGIVHHHLINAASPKPTTCAQDYRLLVFFSLIIYSLGFILLDVLGVFLCSKIDDSFSVPRFYSLCNFLISVKNSITSSKSERREYITLPIFGSALLCQEYTGNSKVDYTIRLFMLVRKKR